METVVAAGMGFLGINMQYATYLTPKVGLPIDLELIVTNGGMGVVLLSGIEAVPFTHRQKSGLFLNALAGVIYFGYENGLAATANIGYQIITKKGFVFNAAVGPKYDTLMNEVSPHLMLTCGYAF